MVRDVTRGSRLEGQVTSVGQHRWDRVKWFKIHLHTSPHELSAFAIRIAQIKSNFAASLTLPSTKYATVVILSIRWSKLSKSWAKPSFSTRTPAVKVLCFRCWWTKNNVHQSHLPFVFRDEGVFNKICRVTIRQRDRVILPSKSQFHPSVHCSSWCHKLNPICK